MTCEANLETILFPDVGMKVQSHDSRYACQYWSVTGVKGDFVAADPWVVFPDTNSVGMDCADRAKSYCNARSAIFDVEQCSVINVNGSFASGAPLLETVPFNCLVPETNSTDDVGDLPAQMSSNLIYIVPGVLAFLLVAVVAICCIIKRRRRQSAGNEGHADEFEGDPHTHTPQLVDRFAINFHRSQQPTSEAGTSDREAEKQRKKENKRKAKEEFKKVSTLVQGIPPQPPTS